MLSYLPVALALLGTALMAVVIFAPVPLPATVTMSFAPPIAASSERHAPDLRWDLYRTSSLGAPDDPGPDAAETPVYRKAASEDQRDADTHGAGHHVFAASWPSRVDSRAADCDVAARIALVEALAAVGGAWASEILGEALAGEPDSDVREAIARAIGA